MKWFAFFASRTLLSLLGVFMVVPTGGSET
jgi:hypothetical protein